MKIGILGTRGIPNNHGGFEQFAEYLSFGLVQKGHSVTVYNSHNHPYKESSWKGVDIIHCYDPESKYGNIGPFIYDLNCILDSRKRDFDIILQLGYGTSSIWGWLLPRKKSIVTTNMDGLEWKRSKYSKPVQRFLLYAEKLGVKYSDYLISDSIAIKRYLSSKYPKDSLFIPYGADIFDKPNFSVLNKFNLNSNKFNLLIARLEPENNIEIILDGAVLSNTEIPFLVIGNHKTKYGYYLKRKYHLYDNIQFHGGIYDINILNNLRYFSNLYFHGHSVGGTNPSLLEAMASNSLICAHDNVFNKSILGSDTFYFKTKEEVATLIQSTAKTDHLHELASKAKKISETYNWPSIIEQYDCHFKDILAKKGNSKEVIPVLDKDEIVLVSGGQYPYKSV